jgi:hypothetical protein
LDTNDSQIFTASATATTTPAYTTYTFNNNTYYYFNGFAYTSEANMKVSSAWTSATASPSITYEWTLAGSANSNLSPPTGTGSTITITHSTQASADVSSTLSVTASATANGISDSESSSSNATVTALAPKTDPTSLTISSDNTMTVYVGNTGNITYSLQPSPCYNNVTFVSSNTSIATVSNTGVVTGVSAGTTTITVTAHKINGTTDSNLTKTVTVNVKDKVVTPVIVFTPDENDNTKATATITCGTTSPTPTIRYTINGADPTASTGNIFTTGFEVNENDEVRAIAVIAGNDFWDDSDVASRTYISCTTEAPNISYVQSGSTATVTITVETGATIYYTTDGSAPSSNSANGTSSVTLNGVTMGTTISAYAKNGTCSASSTVSKDIIISSVSGGVVTLFDYEDHNWTYYKGVDASVDNGYYNTNYLGKLYSPNPRNVKITYKANGGAVSINENETEFVYYKTLEQGATTGQYPYTVISNPFSKRPTGKGFGGWKIKEGADYISGFADEAILPLDAEIVFVNLPYSSTNCTSAEIELEATWVNYNNRTYASGNIFTYSVSGGTYETNFLVLNRNVTGTITVSSPCTIMMVEPDGSTDYRGTYTFSGNITPDNNGVTKIEYARWTTTNNINATGRVFTIGRGIQRPNGGSTLYGSNTNRNVNQIFKIESGYWQNFYALGPDAPANNMTKQHIVFGNDYDRAKGTNTNLVLTNIFRLMDGNKTIGDNKEVITVKSGQLTRDLDHSTAQASGNCFYLWNNSANTTGGTGTRELIVEGGELWHIAGGVDEDNYANDVNLRIRVKGGTIHGSIYGGAARYDTRGYKQFIFTGGTVEGWIAGGSNGYLAGGGSSYEYGTVTGRSYVYIGGTTSVSSGNSTNAINMSVGGNVYGAGCGNTTVDNSGRVTEQTNVVIADDCYVQRGVYGGGAYGSSPQTANVYITGKAHVGGIYENTFDVYGGVYGGARAKGGGTVNIYMSGGVIEHGLYGGSNATGTISNNVTMQINGGQVGTTSSNANIHGGGYGQATRVSGNVEVTLGKSGQTEDGVVVYGDVYGGSALGYVNGTAATDTYHTYVTLNKGIINGSMYGGGLGNANTAANVYGPVTVTVNGGTVNTTSANGSGAVYGCNNINGAPQRAVAVIINGTDPAPDEGSYALDAVYGGGNQANYAAGTPTVTVNNCDSSIDYVYGGGNAAHITNGNTDVTIYGGNKIGNVFGGGNGTSMEANVSGNTNVKIYGGTILNVFGGSNSQGTIGGTINVTVNSNQGTGCPMNIGNVYGGGNMASSNAGNLNIVCTGDGGHIDNIFGGANQADITGDIDLKINGGDIGNVFGGNNQSGEISGNIEVTVGDNPNNCETFKIENVYGGGNLAAYGHGNDYPQVNIVSGVITEGVYGGGYGESAVITGNPQVTVTGGTIGSIYGGGNAAAVTGNTVVSVENATVTEAIYGGSNAANISGTTTVDVISGTVGSGIYGGCNSEGTVGGDIAVNISGGTIGTSDAKANIHGGGYGSSTATSGNVTVNINGSIIHGDVYGGSALGNVNGSTSNTTMVNLTGGTVYGDAYGGGLGDSSNPAYVNGNVTITLNGTAFVLTTTSDDEGNTIPASGRIFGCNNLNGTPKGTVLVKVLKTTPANGAMRAKGTYEVQAVYGGGNLAAYDPTDPFAEGQFTEYTYSSVTASHDNTDKPVQVVIDGCEETSIEYVYGGGNAAPTPATDVTVIGCYEIGNVFGGGNGKDKYTLDGGTTWNSNNGADVGYKGSTSYGTGTTLASIYGGTVHYVFGGSNTKGNIRVISEAAIDEASDCPLDVEEIYGGGNEAYMEGDSKISLGCIDFLQEIYGGAKNANVGGDIELTITSGHFDRVFGGNNLGGTIEGSITVNIEETGCNPITIGELYGCGNAAAYTTPSGKTDPTINIKSFTSIGRVFGGGLGEGAVVTGNPTVNINEVVGENASMTPTTVYAGTTRTLSDGTTVTLPDHTAGEIGAIGTVFGGGNAAIVNGNTNVYVGTESTITYVSVDESSEPIPVVGVDIRGNVYGGGNAADVTGSTNVVIGQ